MKIMRHLIALAIIALVFGYMASQVIENRDVLSAIPWQSHYGKIILHLVGLLLMQSLLCAGWSRLLKMHGSTVSLPSLVFSFFVPNLGKYLPGKILFFAGRVELTYRVGSTRKTGLSTFFFESLFIVLAAALFIPASLSLFISLPAIVWLFFYAVTFVLLLYLTPKTDWLLSLFNRLLAMARQSPLAIWPAASEIRKTLALYVLMWMIYGLSCALLAMIFIDVGWVELLPVAAIFVVAWLAGFLSIITPAGLGVREAVLIVLMQPMADTAAIVMLALLARISWTLVEMGIASIALLLPVNTRQP